MPRRVVALLLLAVFLGAGTTLPGPDALLRHWRAPVGEQRTHVEPPGGCGAHGEKCTLGRTATGAGAAIVQPPIVRTQLSGTLSPIVSRTVEIVIADLDAIPHSRAPPASAV